MTTVGFIGTGNMGGAIIRGLGTRDDVSLVGFDLNPESLSALEPAGLRPASSMSEVARDSDYVVLAVKPHQIESVLSEIRDGLESGMCVLSIAAGVRQDNLSHWVDSICSVVRVMPNTPAMVGEGVFALCLEDETLSDGQKAFITGLFEGLGQVHVLPEQQFDAFTAVAGSGPAYVFYFMEAIIEAGVTMGLTRVQATAMVEGLFTGSAKLAQDSEYHISQLREMVCSPGGTTIEALNVMDMSAVRASIVQAVLRCAEKSEELGG